MPYPRTMQIDLTPDQKAFARRAIETGRLHSEEDAVQEALALWEERERQRAEFLLTLDDARASLAAEKAAQPRVKPPGAKPSRAFKTHRTHRVNREPV